MILSYEDRERAFGLILIMPTFLFVLIFAFYPIIYSFYLSFHRIILGLPELGQKFIGMQIYIDLFHDRVALHSMFNTLVFVFVSTFFA